MRVYARAQAHILSLARTYVHRYRSLLINHQSSFIAHRSLLINHQSSLIAHRSLLIAHCSLLIAHRSSFIVHRSSLIAHRSSLIAHRSSLINYRSSIIAHQLSLIAHRSSLIIAHRSSLITHRSSLIAHRSSLIAHRSSLIAHHNHRSSPIAHSFPHSHPHAPTLSHKGMALRRSNLRRKLGVIQASGEHSIIQPHSDTTPHHAPRTTLHHANLRRSTAPYHSALYQNQNHAEIRTAIPRREGMSTERGVLITTGTVHKQKDLFFFLLQSEYGDLYKVTLDLNPANTKEVTNVIVVVFDTIQPCNR
jgi:hypothetical protein